MPKYICKNKDCSLLDKEQGRDSKITFIDGKIFDTGRRCPECGEDALEVTGGGFTTNFRGGRNICIK